MKKYLFIIYSLLIVSSIFAGHNVDQKGASSSSENSQTEFLPTIEKPISIKEWLVVGPFSKGMRENDIDYLVDQGGEENIKPREGLEHLSIMAPNGAIKWKKVTADEKGNVEFDHKNINMEELQDIYGYSGTIKVSYAYAEVENKGNKRALIIAEKVTSFRLNNKKWPGAVYGYGYVKVPVTLKEGRNKILLKITRGDKFTFKIIPAEAPALVQTKNATTPDIIYGKPLKQWAGITVVNTASKTLKNIKLIIGDDKIIKKNEKIIRQMPPLTIRKIPVLIETKEILNDKIEGDTIIVPVKVSFKNYSHDNRIKLRIRDKDQSYKITFISDIDGSVQYLAVLPPKNFKPDKKYALILCPHGASVEASGLINCYSQKNWAYVVCPTNRKRFGFDWQDWGRIDCLEILAESKRKFLIDENRIYLSGHSMGGHGTWHIGLHYPDLFAAIAPSAGWTSFQLYLPYFLQKSYLFGHPRVLAIRDMALREDRSLLFTENALNLPVYIFHGGADEEVPTVHAKFFNSALKKLNYEVVYKEIPGKKHWWNEKETEGTDCVDYFELMEFLKNHKRNPNPKHVFFKTTNIGLNNKIYWVEINEPEILYYDSIIEAEINDAIIDIKTENINQFTLHLTTELIKPGEINLKINGQNLKCGFSGQELLTVCKKDNRFQIKQPQKQKLNKTQELRKTHEFFGPIKQAYFSPFILVYGTKGNPAATEINLHHARIEAQTWWRRGNGYVEIIPDAEVTKEIIERYNLILFGGAETNSITAKINNDLPISIKENQVYINNQVIKGQDIAVQMIYPNSLNPEKFVVIREGNSPKGEELSGLFNVIYAGAGLPDFIIYDEKVKEKGWAGVIAAGFFDTNWQFCKELTYIKK